MITVCPDGMAQLSRPLLCLNNFPWVLTTEVKSVREGGGEGGREGRRG